MNEYRELTGEFDASRIDWMKGWELEGGHRISIKLDIECPQPQLWVVFESQDIPQDEQAAFINGSLTTVVDNEDLAWLLQITAQIIQESLEDRLELKVDELQSFIALSLYNIGYDPTSSDLMIAHSLTDMGTFWERFVWIEQ